MMELPVNKSLPGGDQPETVPGVLFIFRDRDLDLFGGVPRKILLVAEWLAEHNVFKPMLLTSRESAFSAAFAALGLSVHYIDMVGRGAVRRTAGAAEALITKHNIALIQTHTFWDSVVGRRVRKRHATLRHVYRVHTHIEGSTIPWWRKLLYHALDWWTSGGVDSFCVLSEVIKRELVAGSHIDASKIRVVRNGIPPLGAAPSMTSGQSPIPARLAIIGQVERRKRQDLAVGAIKELKERGVCAQLTLVGTVDESYGDEIKQLAADLGVQDQVVFGGYTDDVYEAIKAIEVVVLPSDFEGIPTSIIEAMSVKKLAIATPAGATAELVEDGANGLLTPLNDAQKLADILHGVFTSPADKWIPLREAGYKTWKEQYSLAVMMDGLLEEYTAMGLLPEDDLRHE